VNVSASLVSGASRVEVHQLGQVASLLTSMAGDSRASGCAQGKHLPGYLRELAEDLVSERDTSIAELSALRSNVEHIKEIVAMQQSYANAVASPKRWTYGCWSRTACG